MLSILNELKIMRFLGKRLLAKQLNMCSTMELQSVRYTIVKISVHNTK